MAIELVFVFLLIMAIVLLAHPYITYPISLIFVRWFRGGREAPVLAAPPTSFAILCCAYNEVSCIEKKIENCLEIRKKLGNVDIIFYSDCSSDGTNEILNKYSSQIDVVIADERRGKTYGMNLIAPRSTAEVLIFTDANVMIDIEKISNLPRYFRNKRVGLVSGSLSFENNNNSISKLNDNYRNYEELLKTLETDTGTIVYTDGTLFAMRSFLFKHIPEKLTDDLFTAISVLCQGHAIVAANDFVAYEGAVTRRSDELKRRVRIGCHVFNCHLALWPQIMKLDKLTIYKYISHKVVRWFSGYFVAAAYLVFLLFLLTAYGMIAGLAFVALTAAAFLVTSFVDIPLVSAACNAVLVMLAFGYGVYLAIRGEEFRTWDIATSGRKQGG